jgi:hypothetical protein
MTGHPSPPLATPDLLKPHRRAMVENLSHLGDTSLNGSDPTRPPEALPRMLCLFTSADDRPNGIRSSPRHVFCPARLTPKDPPSARNSSAFQRHDEGVRMLRFTQDAELLPVGSHRRPLCQSLASEEATSPRAAWHARVTIPLPHSRSARTTLIGNVPFLSQPCNT